MKIAVVGSTGFIGQQTLQIVRQNPQKYQVVSLSAATNSQLFLSQLNEFKPKIAALFDKNSYNQIKDQIPNDTAFLCGADGVEQTASFCDAQTVVLAISGFAALKPLFAAIEAGKTIALANKEAIVCAGLLVLEKAKKHNATIIPVDSEHSAIFQAIKAGKKADLKKIILTASGGAFYNYSTEILKKITVAQALQHPVWNMGKKITLDSGTMANKALEIIEARILFNFENIDYIIHPQSIIHSMVEFQDNSIIAQMSYPDMKIPISYALSYPHRQNAQVACLDFASVGSLQFLPPKEDIFSLPKLAKNIIINCIQKSINFNAAIETADELFFEQKIGFLDIQKLVFDAVEKINAPKSRSIDDICRINQAVREYLITDYERILT